MRTITFTFTVRISRTTGLALAAVMALLTAGLLLGLSILDANATHNASGSVHACVNTFTGQPRFVPDDLPPNCTPNEVLIELGSGAAAVDVGARLNALEEQVPECLSDDNGTALFSGCDVQIVNGEGETGTVNGTGNLIVGYNEDFGMSENRTGSHNMVVGWDHGYSSFGGFVAGESNSISGPVSSVSGGLLNHASGDFSSVGGGRFNEASGESSSVSGGYENEASGPHSSISGGASNETTGARSTVSGGSQNTASGTDSSVTGGFSNLTSNDWATVSGGAFNESSGLGSSVSGGSSNTASADESSVTGGHENVAEARWSTVSGGHDRTADDVEDWVGGSLTEDF